MKITFLNHACFAIENYETVVINDPYLEGTAFNNGWDLIVKHIKYNFNFKKKNFIYYSHEHPDHFSVSFLKSINPELRNKITVLFQETRDKRVKNFLTKLGFKVIELPDKTKYKICEDFFITIGQVPFYDSWALFETQNHKILNTNDCILESPERIKDIKSITHKVDILFTQYSYANWTEGGEINNKFRKDLANEKLRRIKLQSDTFTPKFIIPFASMIRFCHKENSYMNDSINTPETTVKFINKFTNSHPHLMVPYETWDGLTKKDNEIEMKYWNKAYIDALSRPLIVQNKKYSIKELKKQCTMMIERINLKNNKLFISILSSLGVLPKINLKIIDLDLLITFSWNEGLVVNNQINKENCLEISSESIYFLFAFDFGIDTLNVNARFFGSLTNKKKLIRCFAPVALNNTGRYISFAEILSILFNGSFFKQGLRTVGLIR